MVMKKVTDETITLDLKGCQITARMMEGNELWIGMRDTDDPKDSKIWEFHNVAGFYDDLARAGKPDHLNLPPQSSEFAVHLAKELNRPEVKTYREVHIFAEGQNLACLSVCAKKIEMREPTAKDMWMVKPPEEMDA